MKDNKDTMVVLGWARSYSNLAEILENCRVSTMKLEFGIVKEDIDLFVSMMTN